MEAQRLNVTEPLRREIVPKVDGRGRGPLLSHPGKLDKDFMCPICMDPMKDAFLTSCGHSFCYTCITTHLQNRSNCPCCSQYLTKDQIFPNFALDKVRIGFLLAAIQWAAPSVLGSVSVPLYLAYVRSILCFLVWPGDITIHVTSMKPPILPLFLLPL